jgi:Flp pilus assembly protein TadG
MTCRKQQTGKRRGAALVEFALLIPVLLTLLLGIWELGRMVETQQIISNAAREGGRMASTGNLTNDQVITGVRNYLLTSGLPAAVGNNATITVANKTSNLDAASANQEDQMHVTVTVNYNDVRWTALNLIAGPNTTISAAADWYSTADVPVTVASTIPLQ